VNVKATVGKTQAAAALAYPNPRFTTLAAPVALNLPEIKDNPVAMLGAIALAFVAVAMLVGAIALLAAPGSKGMEYLKYYDQLRTAPENGADSDPNSVRTKVVDAVGYVAGKRGFTGLLRQKLEAAGLPLRPAEYMTLHIVAVVTAGFLVQLLTGRLLLAVLAIITVTVVPILLLNISIDLPDVLSMISSSLRGGWGVQQAIDLVVQEAGKPASEEFRRVQTEVRLGIPMDDALQRMADRILSDDFQAAVTAITIQREVGGNLAEVLDIVAATIRDRGSLRRQISALTAEGRLSAYILIALPILEAIALVIMNPEYMVPFTTTLFGAFLAILAVLLLIVGSLWLFSVTRIEV
jgi:tight adherence protein B